MAEGHARLREGGAAVRGAAALVWVEGPDAASFLQGVLTADVAGLTDGASAFALLLDGKGRIRFGMTCLRDAADAFTVLCDAADGEGVADALRGCHVSEDLDVLGPEPVAVLTVGGVDAPPPGGAVEAVAAGTVPGTHVLVVPDPDAALAALGLPEAAPGALEALRVEAGVPRVGVDTGPATLVQEAGLQDVAVSFTKGCYLGQETVARVAHRGHVNRRLRVLACPGAMPVGAAVLYGGLEAGRVTSSSPSPVHGHAALATVRAEVPDGEEVTVEGVASPARIVPPRRD